MSAPTYSKGWFNEPQNPRASLPRECTSEKNSADIIKEPDDCPIVDGFCSEFELEKQLTSKNIIFYLNFERQLNEILYLNTYL